jgi:integrase
MRKSISNGNFKLKVQFNLRKHTPINEPQDIHAVVRFNNKRIVVSGIDKCEPRYWNCAATEERENKGKKDKSSNKKNYNTPRQNISNPRAREIMRNMSDAKSRINEAFDSYIKENGDYPEDLKEFLRLCRCKVFDLPEQAGKKVTKQSTSLIEYVDHFAKGISDGKKVISSGKSKGQAYAKNSSKGYTNLLFNLKAYQNHIGIKDITFNDIDLEFYTEFRNYIIVDRDLTPSYFGDLIKTLKAVMNDAFERSYHTNVKHRSRHFLKETSEADTVFLDTTKLEKLLHLDLSKKPALDKARNLFLLGCYSGLRFSDYSNIKPENITKDFLRVRAQKTKDYISIPISKELREVLDRYPDGIIDSITNQKLNEYAKSVCEEAGFKELVSIREFKKGKEVYVQVPFFKLVSSHTARRSWATNAFKAGYPTILIRAVTGHKTETAFLKYIRMDNEDKSVMMLEMMRRNELKVINGGVE